jgi:hypothetical protein
MVALQTNLDAPQKVGPTANQLSVPGYIVPGDGFYSISMFHLPIKSIWNIFN